MVTIECLKNVIISDSSCCSLYDHEGFTGIRITIGQKRYYFRPYAILLYKKGAITVRDLENSVTFKEAGSNLTFAQVRNVLANCAACGCDAVPVLLTSPNQTISINQLGSGVTEVEVDLLNLASSDAGNQLTVGSDTLWYVPPTFWSTIQGAQNVINVSGFTNDAGYLTSVEWQDIGGNQSIIPLSGFQNDIGFITGVTWAQITGSQAGINLSQFNNDANFVSVGAPISSFANDLNFISVGDDISLLNNNAGYVNAAGAAAAAPIQSVTGSLVAGTPTDPIINNPLPTPTAVGDLVQWNGTAWVARNLSSILQENSLSYRIALDIEPGFVMEVDTSVTGAGTVSATNQIQLTGAVGTYDLEAYQNDVLIQTFNNLSGEQTITLPSAGVYQLKILPTGATPFNRIEYGNSGDRIKVIRILNFGNNVFWSTFANAFFGCAITSIPNNPIRDLSSSGSLSSAFRSTLLTEIPSGIFRFVTEVLLMSSAFRDCNLNTIPAGLLDNMVSLQSVANAFRGNGNIPNVPFNLFEKLPQLTSFSSTFQASTIPTSVYSQMLVNLNAFNNNINVPFDGGNSTYTGAAAIAARANLVNVKGWIITDGGQV